MTVVRRRTTSIRSALLSAPVRIAACAGIAAALLSPWPARPAAQGVTPTADRDAAAAWLAVRPPEPALVCGTPGLVAREGLSGFALRSTSLPAAEDQESPEGQPLWFDQQPRLIRADSKGGLTFEDFLIVGDFETVEFERWSSDAEGPLTETWPRTGTTAIRGRLVSVFNPGWNEAELWDAIGTRRRGFDSPVVYFGTLRIPKAVDPAATPDNDSDTDDEDFEEVHLRLPMAPLNLPVSRVRSINADIQYASHAVNMVVRDFGIGRVEGNDYAFGLAEVTRKFYEFFPDIYDSIAIVPAEQHPAEFGAFHRNVRNSLEGLGMAEFDHSYLYGSLSVLRAVELYKDAQFTTMWTSNHEIGHQWIDYWKWSEIAAGIERAGWAPAAHTPLLFPGEVLLGAVLRPIRRVALAENGEDESKAASYVIERTPAPSLYHPTTLYRMGLIGPEEVPEMVVFENQGQFSEDSSTAPDVGTAVEGGAQPVHINDIMARHGTRSGPVDSSWRRATIVVSRTQLVSPEEMSYWNFFAARHEARSGVTTFGGMPSFHEATGGRALLDTGVQRISGDHLADYRPLQVSDMPIDPGEFRGVQLDHPIPGSMTAGEAMAFAGTISTDQGSYVVEICADQVHIGGPPDEEGNDIRVVTVCDEPAGNRFSMPLTFDRPGRYGLTVALTTRPPGDASEPGRTSGSFMTGITVR